LPVEERSQTGWVEKHVEESFQPDVRLGLGDGHVTRCRVQAMELKTGTEQPGGVQAEVSAFLKPGQRKARTWLKVEATAKKRPNAERIIMMKMDP